MSFLNISYRLLGGLFLILLSSCSQRTLKQGEINNRLYNGDVQGAYAILKENPKKWERGKNTLLYFWERGTVAWMLGEHQESKDYLLRSDYFVEDLYRNYANEALALFTNDRIKEYRGEDHEKILFHYYQILNFMNLGQIENAQVQARRLLLELNRLDDRYKDRKDKTIRNYQQDAFAYILVGLVFEANDDISNAYVAYRNAERVYSTDYKDFFQLNVPEQLKSDILRLAFENGYREDLNYYEDRFGRKFNKKKDKGGNFVFFWNTGLVAIKEQQSFDFVILPHSDIGWVYFYNSNLGITIPVYLGDQSTKSGSGLSDIQVIRASLPRYIDRGSFFQQAYLSINGQQNQLNEVEDVSQIAHKVLQERYLVEVGKMLARVTLKKLTEIQLRKENQGAGAVLGIFNALTEQADIRCWETLPDKIFYTRTELAPGDHTLELHARNSSVQQMFPVSVHVPKRGMVMEGYHTLQPLNRALSR